MRYLTVACLVTCAAFGVLVVSAQQPSPPLPRLTGEAPPPSPLSLWYRAPASDHPLDPPRPSGQGANLEWVRALPVGNGRLGAMVFGGIETERFQLNEDTLWGGSPYDPALPRPQLIPSGNKSQHAKVFPGRALLCDTPPVTTPSVLYDGVLLFRSSPRNEEAAATAAKLG